MTFARNTSIALLLAALAHSGCDEEVSAPPQTEGVGGSATPAASDGGGGMSPGTTGGSGGQATGGPSGADAAGGTGGTGGSGGAAGSGGAGGGAPARTDGGIASADSGGDAGMEVVPPAATDTWESFAKGFFGTYCGSCHNDDNQGDASRNYRVLMNVVRERTAIACGVAKSQADWVQRGCSGSPRARQFPVGGGPRPSDLERDRVLRWIDADTP